MREIKFRAWDKKAKNYIIWEGMYGLARAVNGLAVHVAIADQCYLFPEDMVLEQYAGLKDRNGREIYEGDIVNKGYQNMSLFDRNGVVGMGDGYDSDGWNHGQWHGWKAGESSLFDVNSKCEVIGNIHENPELLI